MDTHIPILAAVVAMTDGPVLELGTGLNSTPLLSEMCFHMSRDLYSIETDPSLDPESSTR